VHERVALVGVGIRIRRGDEEGQELEVPFGRVFG